MNHDINGKGASHLEIVMSTDARGTEPIPDALSSLPDGAAVLPAKSRWSTGIGRAGWALVGVVLVGGAVGVVEVLFPKTGPATAQSVWQSPGLTAAEAASTTTVPTSVIDFKAVSAEALSRDQSAGTQTLAQSLNGTNGSDTFLGAGVTRPGQTVTAVPSANRIVNTQSNGTPSTSSAPNTVTTIPSGSSQHPSSTTAPGPTSSSKVSSSTTTTRDRSSTTSSSSSSTTTSRVVSSTSTSASSSSTPNPGSSTSTSGPDDTSGGGGKGKG